MATSLQGYNITLSSGSPTFVYLPYRDGNITQGWASSFTGSGISNHSQGAFVGIDLTGSGVPFRQTQANDTSVTLSFEGTGIYLCFTANQTTATLEVNQQQITNLTTGSDNACAGTGAESLAYARDMPYGNYTAVLTVSTTSSDSSFMFFGGIVTVGISGAVVATVPVDDTDPGWIYSPLRGWTAQSASNLYFNGTLHFTCSYSPLYTATYSMNGTSVVQLMGIVDQNVVTYTVSLDGREYPSFNGSDYWHQNEILFFAGGLDPDVQHTLILTNYDRSQPYASQPVGGPGSSPCLAVDDVVLIKTTPTSSTSPTPTADATSTSHTNVGAIVGAVIAVLVVLFLLVGAFFLLRRRRSKPYTNSLLAPEEIYDLQPKPYYDDFGHVNVAELPDDSTRLPTASSTRHVKPAAPVSATSTPFSTTSPPDSRGATDSRGEGVSATPRTGRDRKQQAPRTSSTPSTALSPPSDVQRPDQPISSPPVSTLHQASTAELVQLLNSRLRADYMEQEEAEPPQYGHE